MVRKFIEAQPVNYSNDEDEVSAKIHLKVNIEKCLNTVDLQRKKNSATTEIILIHFDCVKFSFSFAPFNVAVFTQIFRLIAALWCTCNPLVSGTREWVVFLNCSFMIHLYFVSKNLIGLLLLFLFCCNPNCFVSGDSENNTKIANKIVTKHLLHPFKSINKYVHVKRKFIKKVDFHKKKLLTPLPILHSWSKKKVTKLKKKK